ncbi:MAG: DUF2924 domain-containing protein [Rhizomicrobium sp.]
MAKLSEGMISEIEALRGADLDVLRQRWEYLFTIAPSPRVSRDVLIRGVAFRLQEEVYGKLGKACRRQLNKLAADLGNGTPPTQSPPSFKPGTKLIREWKGKVHEVVIAGDTYIWSGKHYRSLSQIARSITGTRWSGPRFFGLAAVRVRDCSDAADD